MRTSDLDMLVNQAETRAGTGHVTTATWNNNNVSLVSAEEEQILQDDPCLAKSKVVGDVQYCDRYWECEFGQPELYDCPNGLVWVGKNQGIADGCDYPWRHQNICKNKDLASKYKHKLIYWRKMK